MDIDEEGETAGRPGGRPLHPSSRRFACVGGDAQLARRLIQRAVSRRVGHRPALYKTQPASERSCLSPRERWRRVALTERGRRCTPKAFEECTIRCYALSVTFGDSSPKGGAKAYPHTRIGAFLPLPSGEVAARSADGEGARRTPKTFENVPAVAMPSQSPSVTAPPKGEPRQNRTRIRAFLPLPMGEVAMPQGIDG